MFIDYGDKLSSNSLDGDMPLLHPETGTALINHRPRTQGLQKKEKHRTNKEKRQQCSFTYLNSQT